MQRWTSEDVFRLFLITIFPLSVLLWIVIFGSTLFVFLLGSIPVVGPPLFLVLLYLIGPLFGFAQWLALVYAMAWRQRIVITEHGIELLQPGVLGHQGKTKDISWKDVTKLVEISKGRGFATRDWQVCRRVKIGRLQALFHL